MRLKNRLNNWISIRMGMVIVIFLGVSCGSMRSSTPPPAKDRLTEIDSLERLLPDCPTIASTLPLLRRLAFLYQQQSEMKVYNERLYENAMAVDSISVAYLGLKNLAEYYYDQSVRDSLEYYCSLVDSIAKARHEYPNVLFDVKSLSSQDLLWLGNYELAMSEAMDLYRLASNLDHRYGLLRCSETLGLIYQRIRRDSDAVVSFQESLDLLKDIKDVPDIMDTKVRLTSYQLESSVRTKQYASTERILGQYKALLDEQYKIYQEKNDLLSIKREYWLLYSFYTSFYLSQGDLENAKRSLDQASSYADSNWVEGDYAINTYLTVKARYHKAAGDIPLALHCINEVLETERLPEDIQFKADILKEQGQLGEVMALYDELYSTLTKRRGTSFLRQVNQLRTLHELHEKELKETELKEAGQRIARKQDLLIFILSISVVLLILLYVLFLYYRHLRSLKNQLQREKELLLESQRQLIKEKTRAEEASLMKSAFLANMSHEVRTPLNAIVGFSGLLVEPSTDEEERKEYSSIIRNNTDLMLNLVNDVLDLSRMETGDLHFDIKDHLLLVCCQMALESVRHRIPDGVKLTFSPAGEPIVVHVDNLRLQQLLTNLLTNAAKFTEKGEINLSFQLEPDRKKVCIAVTDTGAGIPLEKQATIFNRFEKLDDYKPGVGLGLSICLLIAERLDGALFIDSSYTDGARFVLILSCEIDSSIYNPPIEVCINRKPRPMCLSWGWLSWVSPYIRKIRSRGKS